jgi:diguanylate cyclase (GGDEF)-like protein
MARSSPHQVPPPPIPEDDIERVEELHSLRILDTAAEERFDRYTRLISDIYEFPIVLVTLVDRDRQWFKSYCGLDFRETGRDISFCAYAIMESGVFIVPDARQDKRFAQNPLVTGPPHIRFYAGCTVRGPSGHPLGSLCVIDREPRDFDDRECRQLTEFARLVERELQQSHELDKLQSAIEFNAYYDPLTRLPNKRLLNARLATLLEVFRAEGGRLAVVLFNVGGLRYINQAFGTATGDELLREVADKLESAMPVGATLGRLGGDEFVMVMPSIDSEEWNDRLDSLQRALDKPYHAGGRDHYINFRIGVSIYPDHGTTARSLLEKASAAIHTRETEGLAAPRHYSQTHALEVSERLRMEARLKHALDVGNFRLEYQPIVALDSGRVTAVEALLRWDDDEIENTSPSRFIPLAEQSGLILPIGEWVIAEAVEQARAWRAGDGQWEVAVAINISAPQLQQHEFARKLLDILDARGVPPSLVQIEVTEFSLVLDTSWVRDNLAALQEAGVRASIDDFGTGYCSLSYLRRMPVSTMKVDRSFIAGVPEDRHDVAITQTILSIAQTLDLKTVAEGVERQDQLALLREAGCDCVQGFLLARPARPEAIPQIVSRQFSMTGGSDHA